MDVSFTPEQTAFQKVSAALALDLKSAWDIGRDHETVASPAPSAEQWRRIVDAGWTALRLEDDGETLGSVLDVAILVEQLGKQAVPAPVLGTLLAAEQLRLAGAAPERQEAVAEGTELVAPCFTADLRNFAHSPEGAVVVDTTADSSALVVTPTAIEQREVVRDRIGADLTRSVADTGALLQTSASAPRARADDRLQVFALTLLAADLLGAMQGSLDAAVEHIKARRQFGVPIGSFQAVQHLAAECLVSIEATRSAVWYAAWAADHEDIDVALEAARTAKAFASEHAVEVVEGALQMFGGIAMTWESPIHVWQRRIHLDRRLLGDEHHHYDFMTGKSC